MKPPTDAPASRQTCLSCGHELPELDPRSRCPVCGGLLEIHHRPPELTRDELLRRFAERRDQVSGAWASGVWRFREIVLPAAEDIVSHPEGNTPLLRRDALDRWTGMTRLLLKHEGHNPTGSFKDRGMTVGVTQARRVGARAVACASTGNTSASLAAYAAQAGIPALVLVP
ncbi:MAG TPA: pyridoxal-phosphate dependent enzyme, partial [Gemmatimonadales bacterium]|nr:pyridoxal-phosphate dependent enzyme [Gemmatimonadales bacterium]